MGFDVVVVQLPRTFIPPCMFYIWSYECGIVLVLERASGALRVP